jgi:hypothetical protein
VLDEVTPGIEESDIASAISEGLPDPSRSMRGTMRQVMGMLGATERVQVESDAKRIQRNVRMWLLRRNYRALKGAAHRVQAALLVKRDRGKFSRARQASRTIQASFRGHQARKEFADLRRQAAAAMVIQRALKTKSFTPEHHSPLHPAAGSSSSAGKSAPPL